MNSMVKSKMGMCAMANMVVNSVVMNVVVHREAEQKSKQALHFFSLGGANA
jgi:riboflavin synthase